MNVRLCTLFYTVGPKLSTARREAKLLITTLEILNTNLHAQNHIYTYINTYTHIKGPIFARTPSKGRWKILRNRLDVEYWLHYWPGITTGHSESKTLSPTHIPWYYTVTDNMRPDIRLKRKFQCPPHFQFRRNILLVFDLVAAWWECYTCFGCKKTPARLYEPWIVEHTARQKRPM